MACSRHIEIKRVKLYTADTSLQKKEEQNLLRIFLNLTEKIQKVSVKLSYRNSRTLERGGSLRLFKTQAGLQKQNLTNLVNSLTFKNKMDNKMQQQQAFFPIKDSQKISILKNDSKTPPRKLRCL